MSLFGQEAAYWSFAWGLREFLKEPLTLGQSREIINQRTGVPFHPGALKFYREMGWID